MTQLTGAGQLSLRKKDIIQGTKNALNVGHKKIRFAHQMSSVGGEDYIPLDNLNFPTQLVGTLYGNPSAQSLTQANLRFYYANMVLYSSARGILIPDISFVATNDRINFLGFVAYPNEIFYGVIDHVVRPNSLYVDAQPVNVSRTLLAGSTTFNLGESYNVGAFPNESSGAVKVFADGVLLFRNTGNSSIIQDRDYYEVNASNGIGTVIEFNTPFGIDTEVTVISNYAYVDRPESHLLQRFDILAAQVEEIAQQGSFNIDLSAFPNRFDIKMFGDRLLAAEVAANNNAKVGDVVESLLTEPQFQAERDTTWILMDGRSVAGSKFEALTSLSNAPDKRGLFGRGKNNGRNDGNENPDGDLALGAYQADAVASHNHNINASASVGVTANTVVTGDAVTGTVNTNFSGTTETRPANITVNYFLKIND